jgi:hypothetical protein
LIIIITLITVKSQINEILIINNNRENIFLFGRFDLYLIVCKNRPIASTWVIKSCLGMMSSHRL